jgi:DNA processing protein
MNVVKPSGARNSASDRNSDIGSIATDVQSITLDDERYPPLLREIHDPPPLLYVRGDPAVLQLPQIAVVGSRRASAAGLRLAETLSGQLTEAGLSVCSGLALGIDGAAHRGALASGGKSVAVMATGIDRLYPRRHISLARELESGGCLVTEFEPGVPPRKGNFPQRNRIISGLSLGVLVIEAALPSGSLITARTAMEQGREVFALPWSILHEGGRGCLYLLRDGAKMVQGVDDILEELGALYSLQQEALRWDALTKQVQELSAEQKQGSAPILADSVLSAQADRLLQWIGFETIAVNELVKLSSEPVEQVMSTLSALELDGYITQSDGGYMRS